MKKIFIIINTIIMYLWADMESAPTPHFNYSLFTISYSFEQQIYGGVAQLARAPALQAGGQEFDSPHLHHTRYKNISRKVH